MKRKCILYIAISLDGYISKPGDDLSFLNIVHKEGEDYGYSELLNSVDTVITGRKTYDWVMAQVPQYPHSNKKTFVITRTAKPDNGNITFYSGNMKDLVLKLKSEKGKHIYCEGGAEIVNELLQYNLIDEIILSIVPVLTGDGVKLFKDGRTEQLLSLISSKQFETGLVQLHYNVKNRN